MSSKKVVLAYEYTGADGKSHKPDSTVEVDAAEANRLLNDGLAREAAADKKGDA